MMTNGEKNKKRFDELKIGDSSDFKIAERIAVRKNGDVDLCAITPCHDCIFKREHCIEDAEKWLTDEAEPEKPEPDKPKQERMVTRTVSNAKGEEVVYYNILYGFGRQDVLEKLYRYEQAEEEAEEEEKMEKDKIKVGDTVKVTEDPVLKGKTGIVRRIYCTNNGKPYVVNFDENFCWTFSDHEIVKVKSKKTPPRIVIYQNGDTVTAKDLETGEKASAVCSKDDTFDFHTGAFIAMSRLTHFEDDIKMMRLETEQIEEDIADMKMRFGALMGEGYKQPEGFSRKEE